MARSTRRAHAGIFTRPVRVAALCVVLALLTLTGAVELWLVLGRGPASGAVVPDLPGRRVISLSPAITRTLVAFGIGDEVVGRTPWCDAVASNVAVAGSLEDFDAETMVRLRPTHVLVQPPAAGVDPGLRALADERGWRLVTLPLDDLYDIESMLTNLPTALGVPSGEADPALRIRAISLEVEMAEALSPSGQDRAAADAAGRVLWLFSVDPPMAFGRGSYFDDVASRLGARNAVTIDGYPELGLEDIQRAQPDMIVLVRDDDGGRAAHEAALRAMAARLTVPADRAGGVALFVQRDAMTPGAGVIDLATALREFFRNFAAGASRNGAVGGDP